jgi:ABC-2 type transport system permease protein
VTRTFAFLILTTFKNRVVAMARRLKKPRYALGLLFGLAYVGLFIWGQMAGSRQMRAGLLQNDIARTIAPAILALVLLTTWFGGATLNALAFTKAEVSLLFTAPVSRRTLVLYKLATAQLPIIINALILAFIFGRGPAAIPRWLAPISLWTTFSTLHLHRLGAALAYASATEHGRSGFKRNWFSHVIGIAIFGGMMAIFIGAPMEAISESSRGSSGNPFAFLNQLVAPLSTPLAQVVLYPFSIIVAPAFSRTIGEWAQAMVPALLLLGLHAWWVLRSQGAFEEAAVEASERRHQRLQSWRSRGTANAPRKVREGAFTLPLSPLGDPAIAIVWKNTLCFLRTFRPLQLIATMGAPIVVAAWFGMQRGEGATALAGICAMFALVLLLAGGSTVRNDLRADMLNLPQLKALPLRGREIVLAEVASSTIPLALMQLALLYVALVSMQIGKHPFPTALAASLAVSIPFGILGLNGLISTIRNGATVFFPSWTKLGVEAGPGPGGFEVIGQAMLSLLAMLLTFLVLLIIPALVTLFIVMYVQPPTAMAIVFSVIVGAFAVAGESWLLIAWIGRTFEKTEPSPSITAS